MNSKTAQKAQITSLPQSRTLGASVEYVTNLAVPARRTSTCKCKNHGEISAQATLRWLEYFNALDESVAKKDT